MSGVRHQSVWRVLVWRFVALSRAFLHRRKIATWILASYLYWIMQADSVLHLMRDSNALFQWCSILVLLLCPIFVPIQLVGFTFMAFFLRGPEGFLPRLGCVLLIWGFAAFVFALAYVVVMLVDKLLGCLAAGYHPNGGPDGKSEVT